MFWKKFGKKRSCSLRYYPAFFLDELRKTTENISQKSSCEILISDFPKSKSSTATLSVIRRVFENRYVHTGTFSTAR
jgi:hypothetical protein